MDYCFAQAARYIAKGHTLPKCLLALYDILCSWAINFHKRNQASPKLQLPPHLVNFIGGIGQFHIHGHVDRCFVRYSTTYIQGAGLTEGEIMETGWADFNPVSKNARAMSLSNRRETLNSIFGEWNWDKLINCGAPISSPSMVCWIHSSLSTFPYAKMGENIVCLCRD
jgi:hypothetical protein